VVALVVGLAAPAGAAVSLPLEGSAPAALLDLETDGLDPDDVARVHALWSEFVAGLPSQRACLLAAPPAVAARTDMAPRAAYAPDSATLYVRPGDLPRLVVFHELAHHLDFECGAADEIGDDLRSAQGIPLSTAWWLEGEPVTWPAEYFANAVAIALGEESRHDVAPATVELVSQWGGVGMVPGPVPSDGARLILDEPSVALTYT
jgi:hypothetical protein